MSGNGFQRLPTAEERRKAGKSKRAEVPRSSHGSWQPPPDRPDPLSLIEEQGRHALNREIGKVGVYKQRVRELRARLSLLATRPSSSALYPNVCRMLVW